MMPLAQVVWIGLTATTFVIWAIMLGGLGKTLMQAGRAMAPPANGALCAMRHSVAAAHMARLAALTAALLLLGGLGLVLWPP